MVLRRRAALADGDMGSRFMAERQQAQGRVMKADRNGGLCDQLVRDQNRRGAIGSENGGVAKSKGGGWVGVRTRWVTGKYPGKS